MDRQIDRASNFTEVVNRFKAYRIETEGQIVRLETLLGQFDETPSGLKDAAFAAFAHCFAEDEISKDALAYFAFENFEVASCKGLLFLARL